MVTSGPGADSGLAVRSPPCQRCKVGSVEYGNTSCSHNKRVHGHRVRTHTHKMLPSFARLSLREGAPIGLEPPLAHDTKKWAEAVGPLKCTTQWENMRSEDKFRLLHDMAEEADRDGKPYLTAYEDATIDDVLRNELWSVEHVVPRLRSSARAACDPIGWIVATRAANQRRGNRPLVLWVEEDYALGHHFRPPLSRRPELARKWLYMRATYPEEVPPLSRQQDAMFNKIVVLAKHFPPSEVEKRVNAQLRELVGHGNPLVDGDANSWYDSPTWRALARGRAPSHSGRPPA